MAIDDDLLGLMRLHGLHDVGDDRGLAIRLGALRFEALVSYRDQLLGGLAREDAMKFDLLIPVDTP